MAPPEWAKGFMRFAWAGWLFNGDSGNSSRRLGFDSSDEATVTMQGHLFYLAALTFPTVACHWGACALAAKFHVPVPGALRLPQLEVKMFQCFAMGMLDTSFAVLCTTSAAPGWKVLNYTWSNYYRIIICGR